MSDEIGKVQFDPRRSGDLMLDMHLQELLGMQQEMQKLQLLISSTWF